LIASSNIGCDLGMVGRPMWAESVLDSGAAGDGAGRWRGPRRSEGQIGEGVEREVLRR